jgi:imidazolonepropionase-like amidohydrolase
MVDRTLLTNGRVLTCTGDPKERPGAADVLVEGDRITAVGPDLAAESARVVDLRGATVVPGLGDAHTHISWPLDFVFDHTGVAAENEARHILDVAAVAKTFLESGYTTIIGAGTLQDHDDVLIKDFVDRGLLPGPRIIPGGRMITEVGGIGADVGLQEAVVDARELRQVVAKQCESGVRAIKMFVSGDGILPEFPSEDVYMNDDMVSAAVDEAERHGAFVTVHARGAESVAMAARCGVRIIHHACFLDDDALAAITARGDDVWVCPGLHYLWAVVNGHAAAWGVTDDTVKASGYDRELEGQIESLRQLHDAGVQILSGGDFGHQWTHHGTYAAELQRYVDQVGMTPTAAILTATKHMGSVTGTAVGQVREGFLADLLLVEGDPTEDITLLQRPERRRAVMKDGEFVYVNPALHP